MIKEDHCHGIQLILKINYLYFFQEKSEIFERQEWIKIGRNHHEKFIIDIFDVSSNGWFLFEVLMEKNVCEWQKYPTTWTIMWKRLKGCSNQKSAEKSVRKSLLTYCLSACIFSDLGYSVPSIQGKSTADCNYPLRYSHVEISSHEMFLWGKRLLK